MFIKVNKFIIIVFLFIVFFMGKNNFVNADEAQITFAPIVKQVAKTVVSIYAIKIEGNKKSGNDNKTVSIGSGVLIDKNGLIVTNYHVIDSVEAINVILLDGREYKAKIIAKDENLDLALLKIDSVDKSIFNFLPLKSDTNILVGDVVLAIGNPFGIGNTVTLGIVSAMANKNNFISSVGHLIQTDAAVNPGNSGGALVDTSGKLVGINSAIYNKNGIMNNGIGFAIPVEVVKLFVDRALLGQKVRKYWIGVGASDVNDFIAKEVGLKIPKGVIVGDIYKNGPGEKAGLQVNDVIVKINDKEIQSMTELSFMVASYVGNSSLKLNVFRKGKYIKLNLIPELPDEKTPRDIVLINKNSPLDGISIANNSSAIAYEIGNPSTANGVVIYKINIGNFLYKMGVDKGDFIREINGKKIKNVKDLLNILDNVPLSVDKYHITIEKNGELIDFSVNR